MKSSIEKLTVAYHFYLGFRISPSFPDSKLQANLYTITSSTLAIENNPPIIAKICTSNCSNENFSNVYFTVTGENSYLSFVNR